MSVSYTYLIHLTRYKDFKRYQSGPYFHKAEDFSAAVEYADALLMGSRDADPDAVFEIASIEAQGLNGSTCVYGWMTMEEMGCDGKP